MNASKLMTAAIAAATIIGTVGYVSAQTTTTEPSMQQPVAPAPADTTVAPAKTPADASTTPAPSAAPSNVPSSSSDMSTPAVTSDVNAAPAEPAPKADRN